jgi:hypothetical protein
MNYRLTRRSFAVDGKMKEVIVKVIVGGFARLEIGPVISRSPSVATDNAMKMGRTPTFRLFLRVKTLLSS